MCGAATLNQSLLSRHPQLHRQLKRRSADVGGLHLATGNSGQGKGWVGIEMETKYAELLSDMYNQTLNAVNEHNAAFVPTSLPKPTRSRLIRSLDCWHFEPHKLPEEEILACTMILFEALYRIEGMAEVVGVSLRQLSLFVHHLRQIYRYENTYHNFEHALDVLQATQCYLVAANMVPPVTILLERGRMWKSSRRLDDNALVSTLGLRDLFAVYVAAIGHDVGHPGFTNVFMKNAQTPLSIVFDGQSALEQLHCQLLLRVMRHHGLGILLDDPAEGTHFRKLLLKSVLVTDMSVHGEFMQRFQEEVNGLENPMDTRKILVAQALLKNADISNPSRPFPVAEHWANALMQEWTAQARLEEHYSLQQSVQTSDDPLAGAKSQVFFISTFVKPLLDLTVKAIPEMARYAQHCDMNLERWLRRKSDLESRNDAPSQTHPPPKSPRQPSDFQSAFPLTLPQGPSGIFPATSTTCTHSVASSDSDPTSPCESATSSFFSPVSELPVPQHNIQYHHAPSSSTSSSGSGRTTDTNGALSGYSPQDEHEAIRAAGKLSIRQIRKVNRNSWCATSTFFNGLSGAGYTWNSSPLSVSLSTISSPVDGSLPPPPTAASQLNGTPTKLSSSPISITTNGASGSSVVDGHQDGPILQPQPPPQQSSTS